MSHEEDLKAEKLKKREEKKLAKEKKEEIKESKGKGKGGLWYK